MNPAILAVMNTVLSWFLNRSKEPSSLAGVAILAQFVQAYIPDAWIWLPGVLDWVTGFAAALAVAMREKAQPPKPNPSESLQS